MADTPTEGRRPPCQTFPCSAHVRVRGRLIHFAIARICTRDRSADGATTDIWGGRDRACPGRECTRKLQHSRPVYQRHSISPPFYLTVLWVEQPYTRPPRQRDDRFDALRGATCVGRARSLCESRGRSGFWPQQYTRYCRISERRSL